PRLQAVSIKGRRTALRAREFNLLWLMAQHPNKELSSEWITEQMWGTPSDVSPKLLAVAVHRLRAKIEVNPDRPVYLTTVRGCGYKLVDPGHPARSGRSYQEELDELREVIEALVLSRLRAEDADAALAAEFERTKLIAEKLQRSMLLKTPENAFPGLTIESTYAAVWDEAEVGGDYFDAFGVDHGGVALVVGDVAGKGINAAARTLELKYALRAFLQNGRSLCASLSELNNFAVRSMIVNHHEDEFAAITVAVLDPVSGQTEYATVGTAPPLIIRDDGSAEILPERPGMLLGVELDSIYPSGFTHLSTGDILLLATDGITEARTGSAFLNSEGLARLAAEAAKSCAFPEIGPAILDGASAFAGGELRDDACLLMARRDY
ncbi:MAG: SpoIIE family protein phosphatase, partial [Chloroflexi bacterium]|nr:SpoIIE family protein phosphatase [Chloroflexota bacterium]